MESEVRLNDEILGDVMRILLVMLFSLILAACGQDYEEVHGIKIGAPIEEVEGLGGYDSIKSCELTIYTNRNLEEKDNVRAVLVVNRVVVGVLVNDDESQFKNRIIKFREKYGAALEKEDDEEWLTFESDAYHVEAHPIMTTYTTRDFHNRQEEISYGCE